MLNKLILAVLAAASVATAVSADEYVHGYTKRDGTYVQPYYRSSPNDTRTDNYSSRGNTNPYTGQQGTMDPYSTSKGGNSGGNGGCTGSLTDPC